MGQFSCDEGLERRPHPGDDPDTAHGVEQVGPLGDETGDSFVERRGRIDDELDERPELGVSGGDGGATQVVDIVEVAEQRARRQPGPVRYLIGARIEVAVGVEPEHRSDDGITIALPTGPAAVGLDVVNGRSWRIAFPPFIDRWRTHDGRLTIDSLSDNFLGSLSGEPLGAAVGGRRPPGRTTS